MLSKLRADKVALSSSLEANQAESRRITEILAKTVGEMSGLQVLS